MPIPLGILAAAGARQAAGATFQLLESTVLTGSQASVSFTNLATKYSATYEHLQVRFAARSDRADNVDFVQMTFNGDTATNYSLHYVRGDGGSVSSLGLANQNFMWAGFLGTANHSANIFAPGVIDVLDAFSTSKNKTVRSLGGVNANESNIGLFSGLWINTNAVTSITLDNYGSNYVTGSRFSLYGIKATA